MANSQKAPQYLPYEQHPFSKSAKVHTWLVGSPGLSGAAAVAGAAASSLCLEHMLLEHMNYISHLSSMSLCSDSSGLLGEERLLTLKLLQLSTSLFRFSLSAKIPISAIAEGTC